jgi:uncharacterized membrane protein
MQKLIRDGRLLWLLVPLVVVGGIALGWALSSWLGREPASLPRPLVEQQVVEGEIVAVLGQGQITLGERPQTYQDLAVRILEGEHQGEIVQVERGRRLLLNDPRPLRAGERLLISFDAGPQGEQVATVWDVVRTRPLALLLAVFVGVTLLVSGWKGARSLLGMGLSLGVILFFILPQILAGRDPVLVSVLGSAFLLSTTLYLVHGWGVKTHSAVLGTLVALVLTALLAHLFLNVTHLTGFGSEEAMFLTQWEGGQVQIRGLLLGGIIIGTLGVLDDLSISQAASIQELHLADARLSWASLFQKGMNIGRDHIAATVNTLVLAYVGASLPLLLLFLLSDQPALYLLSREMVAEEVVRTLVGSLGLIAAVPLTTALAAWLVARKARGP